MVKSFKPIIDKKCTTLILGSAPGVKSLELNQYYGHPRNQFWRLVYTLFEAEYEESYEDRKQFLLKNHIALWDVIKYCDREGSLDTAIKNEEANDFEKLFNEYPSIKTVIFNGDKAYKTFRKLIGFEFQGIEFYKVGSTSPAHAISFEKRLADWNILRRQRYK